MTRKRAIEAAMVRLRAIAKYDGYPTPGAIESELESLWDAARSTHGKPPSGFAEKLCLPLRGRLFIAHGPHPRTLGALVRLDEGLPAGAGSVGDPHRLQGSFVTLPSPGLRTAGERVDMIHGCDTPEWMADEIEVLRAEIERLRAAGRQLSATGSPQIFPEAWDEACRVFEEGE